MDESDILGMGLDAVTVDEAAHILNRTPYTVRRQLREKILLGDKWGRDWKVPVLVDQNERRWLLISGKPDETARVDPAEERELRDMGL